MKKERRVEVVVLRLRAVVEKIMVWEFWRQRCESNEEVAQKHCQLYHLLGPL
jgi:hypothetical protein